MTLRPGANLVGGEEAGVPVRFELLEDARPSPGPTPTPAPAPNDPLWVGQWGPEAVGARIAWAFTKGRPEIVVAILDTGIDLAHPDLAGGLVPGTDVGAGDSDPTDEYGHGTHVAGIVAAASGTGIGVSGVRRGEPGDQRCDRRGPLPGRRGGGRGRQPQRGRPRPGRGPARSVRSQSHRRRRG